MDVAASSTGYIYFMKIGKNLRGKHNYDVLNKATFCHLYETACEYSVLRLIGSHGDICRFVEAFCETVVRVIMKSSCD